VRRAAIVILVVMSLMSQAPGFAGADEPTVTPGDPDTIDVGHGGGNGGGPGDGSRPGSGVPGDGGPGDGGGHGPGAPPPPTIPDPQVLFRDGRPCVIAGSQLGDPESSLAFELELRYLQLLREYETCPGDQGPGPGPLVASPAAAIAAWADQADLPPPILEVQPGSAIAGKAAYLEIGGPRDGTWHFEAHGWSIDISAASTYKVDWGDGTIESGLTSQGGPWPHGDIRHTYLTAGGFTIDVTQNWTADWTASGHGRVRSGRIDGLLWTRAELVDFPVEEVQAVRTR